MGKIMEKFDELCAECNQIFADCKKSFEEGKYDKFILTDKRGHRERIIPFKKIIPYLSNYGTIYSLFGVSNSFGMRKSIDLNSFLLNVNFFLVNIFV